MDERIAMPPPAVRAKIDTNSWTSRFWEAAAEHRLEIPRCGSCAIFRMPPTPFCPNCRSQEVEWVEIGGEGLVYSYTIVERAVIPGTEGNLPYVPAIIELPEAGNVRLISNVVSCPVGGIEVGKKVSLVWEDLSQGKSLPQFTITPTPIGTDRRKR